MASLDIVPMHQCSSWKNFSKSVEGSKGKTYTVTHGETPWAAYQFGFECTCKAFEFGRGKECKHIKAAKSECCLWHEQFDGGTVDGGKCPNCAASVEGIMVGV